MTDRGSTAGQTPAKRTGLVQVYTGDGKGKTTACVGLAVRAAGAGLRVVFVQFVKGGRRSSELAMLEQLGVRVERPAEASTGLLAPGGITDEDRRAAREAWDLAAEAIASGAYRVWRSPTGSSTSRSCWSRSMRDHRTSRSCSPDVAPLRRSSSARIS